jgi:hypothetical protein
MAFGGGIVAVSALSLLGLVALYGLGWSGSSAGLWRMRVIACLALAIVFAGLVWTARRGTSGFFSTVFGISVVGSVGYAVLALLIFRTGDELAQQRAHAYRRRIEVDSKAAESAVRSLTFCAISYRANHTSEKLPDDLESFVHEAGCDAQLLDARKTPEYRLTFSARLVHEPDKGSDRGCLVTASFMGSRLPVDRGGLFSDGSIFTGDCFGVVRTRDDRSGELVVGFGPGTALDPLLLDLAAFRAKE